MESEVRILNRNLVCINGIEEVIMLCEEICEFITKLGKVKITGNNLETLQLSLENKSALISGVVYCINY